MNIRAVTMEDASAFLTLCQKIEQERESIHFHPGEAIHTVAAQRDQLEWFELGDNRTILIAETEQDDPHQMIGYVQAIGGELKIDSSTAVLAIEILKRWHRKGIGTQLMQSIEAWAYSAALHRLELTVLASNEPAINLYYKMGYDREGVKRHSRLIDGTYVDEWIMGKLLT